MKKVLLPLLFILVFNSCDNKNTENGDNNSQTDSLRVTGKSPNGKNSVSEYLYVALNNKKKIAIYQLDTTSGDLHFKENIDVNGSPGSMSHSHSKKYFYASLRSSNEVASFSINQASGGLNHIKNTPIAGNSCYIIPDKTNRYLLTAYWSANKVAIYPITGDSIIEETAVQEFDPGKNPHCILNSEDNNYTYVAVMTSGTVNQYSFNEETGKIKELNPAAYELGENVGPRHIDIHPNNKWVYIVNEINNTLNAYTLSNGKLSLLDEINTLPESFTAFSKCSDIHITPNGKYVYIANRGLNSIAAFRIKQEDGTLGLIGQYDTEPNPREFEIDKTGKFLIAGGEDSGKMVVYKIKEDGSLQALKTYEAGESVTWLMTMMF